MIDYNKMSLLVKDTNVMSDTDLGITVPVVTQNLCRCPEAGVKVEK